MNLFSRSSVVLACTAVIAFEGIAVAGWQMLRESRQAQARAVTATVAAAMKKAQDEKAKAEADSLPIAMSFQVRAAGEAVAAADDPYYASLRPKIHWVPTRVGASELLTPDAQSRLLLAKSAAERARLWEVGLGFRDVYGIINAETSWVPRAGMGKNGTVSSGIAQFEPATARALGMRNPHDPVESVHVAALHMREAALWAEQRIEGLRLGALERGIKLREGVSIYYNLSSRGRSAWNGKNTARLPRETQLHILNARMGARQADYFEAKSRT